MAMEHGFAAVGKDRLHYVRSGQGQLLLFLHGFPEFWYAWRKQLAEFGKTHLVVAPDLRGYNLSSKPPGVGDYAMAKLVEDIRHLAAEFGFGPNRPYFLAGHDWGGVLAWMLAISFPEELKGLVILNAPHPALFARRLRESWKQRLASWYMLLFRSRLAEPLLRWRNYAALEGSVFGRGLRDGRVGEEELRIYRESWAQPGALTAALKYYRAAPLVGWGRKDGPPEANNPAWIKSWQVRVPALVLWGEKDIYLLPELLDGLESLVPQLTLRRVSDATHWVAHEKPELVNEAIREFLATIG